MIALPVRYVSAEVTPGAVLKAALVISPWENSENRHMLKKYLFILQSIGFRNTSISSIHITEIL